MGSQLGLRPQTSAKGGEEVWERDYVGLEGILLSSVGKVFLPLCRGTYLSHFDSSLREEE